MGLPGEEIASGLIQGGATLLAGHMQNKANAKMNAQNLQLAYKTRADQLAAARRAEAFNREQFQFNSGLALQDREYQSTQDRLNRDTQLKQFLINAYNQRASTPRLGRIG
jgi:hypothetical protein